ncbi:TolC family protein [Jejudonia soesokkakensis]|uniref:TolC family protein n=1 Tax=Jejudonia soesokkakensis TaxID=1323432 RepID=A0ABW2MWD2_9FLAO
MNRIIFYLTIVIALLTTTLNAQETNQTLSFEEFLGFVKQHHPLTKQANLVLKSGEANLLRARGGFDPTIEVDYDRKKFKNTEYFDQLNTTFKVPTWYGVEFKANFEENTGQFLDPSLTVPEGGLYSAGVSFSLAQGLLINERMASLKKAKFFNQQSQADRDLLINNLLFEASKAYFEWLEAFNTQKVYTNFLTNATSRLNAVKRSVEEGDKATIDITEASITVQNRALELEAASLTARKAKLKVSNYLWVNDIPLLLEDEVLPIMPELALVENILTWNQNEDTEALLNDHPKMISMNAKIEGLEVDRKLKLNKLLPNVDLQYNFLSQEYDQLDSFNTENYKAFLNIRFPLFLRKERGEVQLANYKLQDAQFERNATRLTIVNKIEAIKTEISSLRIQNTMINNIVIDYQTLVKAEERKFFLGEGSLFLIISREQKLIDAQLKEIALTTKQLQAAADLFNTLGTSGLEVN